MKDVFKKVIQISMMDDDSKKEKSAKELFDKLNSMEMPQHFNWASDIFEDIHVKENPDKTALIWTDIESDEEKNYSYKQLKTKADRLLNLMRKSGVKKGSSFYLMAPSDPETWFATLACIKGGIINVPTATSMTQRTLEFRFDTFAPDVIMADENSTHLIDTALKETDIKPKLKLVIGKKQGWVSFDETDKEPDSAEKEDTKADDFLFCFFTSGTTGLPKRVGHTAISYPVGHLSTTVMTGIKPDDIHNNLSSPGWSKWAWSNFFAPFNVGATVSGFKFTSFDAEQYMGAVSKKKITSFCASPTAWKVFAKIDLDFFNLKFLKQALSAGEPLHADISEKFMQKTGIMIREYYGQTETTAMAGTPPWMKEKIRPGSFGVPFFMYDMALVDSLGNEVTKPGEQGHIVIKLDKNRPVGLFREYIGSPDKMHAVFVNEYYYTGDKASLDQDGYWWFRGRADDVIKSSDFRIGPFEVESALMEHHAVMETAVIGSPDQNRYQLVKAYVVLNPEIQPSRELALELFSHAMTILPKFKIPRIIEFVCEVPKTISGKIRRVQLRRMESAKESLPDLPEESPKEYFYWDFPELGSKKF